ncbi:MAG: DUF3422 domain-containing protein [Nitrospira sp. SB0678_bin_10]|nr:DUF3422 domain-containing protein [Nitrospira sp. SB0662_bin_26]MYF25063.1 DUF3422 domain-containing protein [Nitrospira sp. SB0678_bin_10]
MSQNLPASNRGFLRHLHEPSKKYLEEWFDVPAHIHHVAHHMANPPLDRPQSRHEFQQLLQCLDIPDEHTVIHEKFGHGAKVASNGDRLLVTWEAHTEYYSYQVWHIPDDKWKPLEFGPLTFPDYLMPFSPLGILVNALDILVLPHVSLGVEEVKNMMPGPQLYGSRIFGQDISVMTTFTPDEYKRERYLIVSPSFDVLLTHVARTIDTLVAIENYTHLILFPFQAFAQSVDQVHQYEQRHLYQRGVIATEIENATPQKLQRWLTVMTQDFMNVSRMAESMRYKLSASVPYDRIIRANLALLHEQTLAGCRRISDYVDGKTIGVADGYQQFVRRINALVNDFQGSIAMIRTKVELQLQDQNLALENQILKLLRSMDKTTRRQAILQHTVEGLSVIVISYYLSGLGSYVFKAMKTLGWIENADLFSGLFVPISLGIAFGLILLGRRFIYQRRFEDSTSDATLSDPSNR